MEASFYYKDCVSLFPLSFLYVVFSVSTNTQIAEWSLSVLSSLGYHIPLQIPKSCWSEALCILINGWNFGHLQRANAKNYNASNIQNKSIW